MKITHKLSPKDPVYPIMHGKTPMAKEFNKRQKKLWETGVVITYNYEQISTVLLEILADDFSRRHVPRKKKEIK